MNIDIPDNSAFLMVSESEHNADMYYSSGFLAYDPFIYLNSGKDMIIVSDMELGRARKESTVKDVFPSSRFGIIEKLHRTKDLDIAYCEMIREILQSNNIRSVAVPYNFPVHLADCLRRADLTVTPVKSPLREMREIKSETEIKAIEYAQRAAERALSEGIMAIKEAYVRDGVLMHENSPLRAEDLRTIIARSLLLYDCEAPDIIIACGKGSSDPHWKGEGELLADEPIVIDMVPRSKQKRYYSDMTRTVLHGTPGEDLKNMYSAVLDAQITALNKIKAGITGADIHNIVCDVFEERGYETSRGKISEFTEGFIHSTGHGVGLDIHEGPGLGENGKELKAGSVVTVEPGLYYKNIGGVRLEDIVVVTQNGCKNLTIFEKNLVLK